MAAGMTTDKLRHFDSFLRFVLKGRSELAHGGDANITQETLRLSMVPEKLPTRWTSLFAMPFGIHPVNEQRPTRQALPNSMMRRWSLHLYPHLYLHLYIVHAPSLPNSAVHSALRLMSS